MKARLITFHTPKNYGAVLQAYSLMKHLQSKGLDVEVIDYNTERLRKAYPIIPKPNGVKDLIRTILLIPTYGKKREKYKKFEQFVSKKLRLTKRFESVKELSEYPWDEGTLFVTGSDQVFNPNRIFEERRAFYLDFVPENFYKFSYAGSFGVSSIDKGFVEEAKGYLSKFNKISVREKSGVDIVNDVIGTLPTEVLDPVFLNDKEFWVKNIENNKIVDSPYVLYYRLMNSKSADKFAMETAKKLNKKLVVITDGFVSNLKSAKILRNVGPDDFLTLYNGADYVLTDSFHGIAFSIIFEKDFCFCDFSTRTNDRGLNLIKKLQLQENVLVDGKCYGKTIDYVKVKEVLNGFKQQAFSFIDNAIQEADHFKREN